MNCRFTLDFHRPLKVDNGRVIRGGACGSSVGIELGTRRA